MLILPSGKIVDLSTNRAKYHALRKQGEWESKQCSLYPLVDVIIRYRDKHGTPLRGWSEFDYQYSGYTISDIYNTVDWSQEDKELFFVWIREDIQQNTIKSARIRLKKNQSLCSTKLSSTSQFLYSLLIKRIQKLTLQSASSQQWLATINKLSQQGIRKDELEWSGCINYLKGFPDDTIISKSELLTNIDQQQNRLELSAERIKSAEENITFKEVAMRMSHQGVRRAALKLDENCICILRYHDEHSNYRIGVIKTLRSNHKMALNKYWFVLDAYGRAIPSSCGSLYYRTSYDAIDAANKHASTLKPATKIRFNTQFDHLTLYGGYDYREHLVSLPDYQRTFFGAHYFDHNVLVHIRTTIRKDIHGHRLLFIEEIQSDWHQQGKLHGYDNNPWGKVANAPFKKEWAILAIKLMLIRASQNNYDAIAWPKGEIQEIRYRKALPAIKRRYDSEIPKSLNRMAKPFNTSVTHTYIETCDPWLILVKEDNRWRIEDYDGKFKTRARYTQREDAMEVLHRHSRHIKLQVHALFITNKLRNHIFTNGLPLFGTVSS